MSVPTECVSAAHEKFFLGAGSTSSTSSKTATSPAVFANVAPTPSLHENGAAASATNTIVVETYEAPQPTVQQMPDLTPTPSPSCSASPRRQTPAPAAHHLPTNGNGSNPADGCCATIATSSSSAPTNVSRSPAKTIGPAQPVPEIAPAAASGHCDGDQMAPAEVSAATAANPAGDGDGDDASAQTEMADLLRWNDMPRHLQFNQYIFEGYRPLTDAKGCICSLFYFHNETVNILTHGIPVLYILATVPYLLPWDDFRWLSWCHLLGTLAPWCGSFVYHLFMNLDQGEVVYYRLLKLDMFGIWMSQSFGAITFVTATAFCWKLRSIVIGGYCILCLWGLYKALLANSPWQRRLCFLFPFVMRLHLVVFRILKMGGGNTESMVHVYLQDGVSIVGGAIGAMNIPEKWLPGNVDFFLNSHNIMHVLVVVAVYSMHQASMRDMEWMAKSGCSGLGTNNDSMTLDELVGIQHNEL